MDRLRTAMGVAALVTVAAACTGGDVTGPRTDVESRTDAAVTGKGGGWSGSGYRKDTAASDTTNKGWGGWAGTGH